MEIYITLISSFFLQIVQCSECNDKVLANNNFEKFFQLHLPDSCVNFQILHAVRAK